jgi:formylglycine-generating enzyme required for sulfatase activity
MTRISTRPSNYLKTGNPMKPSIPTFQRATQRLLRALRTRFLPLLGSLATLSSASSQTPADLSLQLHPGLRITGTVGIVYSIEYVTDLGQSNNPDAWQCLEFIQLPVASHFWTDKSSPATGQRFYRAVAIAPTNMVFIPPGSFRMGSPADEVDRHPAEGVQTAVMISRGFWMGRHEVTQGEYKGVMGRNPSYFTPANGYSEDLTLPVDSVSWADAGAYCNRLTSLERAAGRIPSNSQFRLPTEAEWEYACRAWTSSRFSHGDDPGYANLANYAWYDENSGGLFPHPVEQKLPNPWGLYDMSGNVFEWCHDWEGEYVDFGGIKIDPPGPGAGTKRVLRGGSWFFTARRCRSAYRGSIDPGSRDRQIGFRIVLAIAP